MPGRFEWYSLKLTVIIFAAYLITIAFPGFVYSNFAMISSDALAKPWMFVTHIFLHGSFIHLAFNLFALLLFGSILERITGSKKFLVIFFAAGVVSAFGDLFFYPAAVGASGAIFGILGCLAVLRPKLIVWVYGIPMYMVVAIVIWAFLDLAGIFYPDDIAHAAHLFGMGFGIASGFWMRSEHRETGKGEVKYEVVSDEELDEWEKKYMM
jgi:membrane associated rhomboid family serine protease